MEIINFIDKETLNLINFTGSSYCLDTNKFFEVRYKESEFNKIKHTHMTFWELSKVKKLTDITSCSPIQEFYEDKNISICNVSNL